MTKYEDLVTCEGTSSIQDVCCLMSKKHISAVVVVDSKKQTLGFISKTDIIEYISAFSLEKTKITANDLMNTEILYCQDEDDIIEATETLVKFKMHHFLVKDSQGVVVGLMSSLDFAKGFVKDSHKGIFEKLFKK
eukprot:gene5973-9972_t